jgi:hypothetical protein
MCLHNTNTDATDANAGHLKFNTVINVKNSAISGHIIGNHLNVCVAEEAATFTKSAVKLRCRKLLDPAAPTAA